MIHKAINMLTLLVFTCRVDAYLYELVKIVQYLYLYHINTNISMIPEAAPWHPSPGVVTV